jgi:hypothetical protein
MGKRFFISADHGLAIVYFLQSDIIPTIIKAGHEVVVLTDDALKEKIASQFQQPGLVIEGLRFREVQEYAQKVDRERQWWLGFFRRVASSNRINTQAMDSYIRQIAGEEGNRRRVLLPAALLALAVLRRSKAARQKLVQMQARYTPNLYRDLFERYQPDLVAASTYGWRLDRYLLREAAARGLKTAAAIVGWDNPSSYGLPAARVDMVSCWSEVQKEELVLGSDWDPEKVNIGGVPAYDGYFRREWLIPRSDYYRQHSLDPDRKLIAYAASFVSFSPNYQNVAALAELVSSESWQLPHSFLSACTPTISWTTLFTRGKESRLWSLPPACPTSMSSNRWHWGVSWALFGRGYARKDFDDGLLGRICHCLLHDGRGSCHTQPADCQRLSGYSRRLEPPAQVLTASIQDRELAHPFTLQAGRRRYGGVQQTGALRSAQSLSAQS